MKLNVWIIKTRLMSSFFATACRIRIGGDLKVHQLEMTISEEDADKFIHIFSLYPEPAQPTDLKLNKKRFFDIKYS